ncbi:unnamed protein product [Meganyctiphanes norvegica]|uniref:Uncharacterized protein n=1 Tax=Meganyctiphanes norvegica TaxID=48144 RepID=A0AAV2Q0K5_MEGNR
MAGSGAIPAGSLTGSAMQHVRQMNTLIRQKQQQPPEKEKFITPYLWPDNDIAAKKGFYRVDFGPDRKTEMYFLPNPSDRLNFLQKRSISPAPNLTTMDSPSITAPRDTRPMKQRADMFIDNVQAETAAMKIEDAPRSSHRHRMLDDVAVRARSGPDGYSNRRSFYWQLPHFRGLSTRRTTSLPRRRHSMIETWPVHGRAMNTCSTRAEEEAEVDVGYQPMAAPPMPMRRMPPPPPPMYYDYDYGYGGGYDYYGGAPAYAYPPQPMAPPPMQRMSRYDAYMEEDPELASMGAGQMAVRQSARPRTPPMVPTPIKGRGEMPPSSMAEFDQRESEAVKSRKVVVAHNRDCVPHSQLTDELPESEGERHLARMTARYPSFSEPQMLQDHVDKMRIRLKSLAYSLDPTGPVPEIVIPERAGAQRPTSVQTGEDSKKKYTMALEYKEMPNLSTRRSGARTYPEDEYMKDNLRIKCLSHYKTTRTAADSEMTKAALPDSFASKYANKYQTKWEEPDTIYGSSSDKKPFSKVETGSSFFSTYGYTNRKKDTIAEKVRDYYYGVEDKEPMAEICPAPEPTVERKKSKSKKTKEEPLPVESAPAPVAEEPVSFSAVSDSAPGEEPFDPDADEKEKKKLEKKKRKAEREAAAKAAMEAELAALAAAEAELARLEQESASLATPAAAPEESYAPVEIPTVEVQRAEDDAN